MCDSQAQMATKGCAPDIQHTEHIVSIVFIVCQSTMSSRQRFNFPYRQSISSFIFLSFKLFFSPNKCIVSLFFFEGKTSLAHALVYGRDGNVAADQRTVGLDYYSWKPRPLTDELEILLVDCAGQRNYLLTHQFFLTEGELIFFSMPKGVPKKLCPIYLAAVDEL